jgi:hypothetical protein
LEAGSHNQCLKDLVMRGAVHERDAVRRRTILITSAVARGNRSNLPPRSRANRIPPGARRRPPPLPRRGLGASLMPTMDTPPFAASPPRPRPARRPPAPPAEDGSARPAPRRARRARRSSAAAIPLALPAAPKAAKPQRNPEKAVAPQATSC